MAIPYDERYSALESKCAMKVNGAEDVGALDMGLLLVLKRASLLVKGIVGTEGDAFSLSPIDKFGDASVVSSAVGTKLYKLIKMHIPLDARFNALYTLEPYIELAVNQIMSSHLYAVPILHASRVLDDAKLLLQKLNECVDNIRSEAKSAKFRFRLNSYQRSSNKNHKEVVNYIDALFERYSRLLVLRIDLGYRKQASVVLQAGDKPNSMIDQAKRSPMPTQIEAKQDREHLFENARSNKLFGNMVGYIWKLEHGPEKGFHYHVVLFFDGSKVREDVSLARRIGTYWVDIITKGRGLYYNCNAFKFKYKSCGIGMINHSDLEFRERLQNAVVYLTKTDLYMKLQTIGRSMGKGARPRTKDSRGRPRKKL